MLFNLYVDDVVAKVKATGAKILLYADDLLLLVRSKAQLTSAIKVIEDWSL